MATKPTPITPLSPAELQAAHIIHDVLCSAWPAIRERARRDWLLVTDDMREMIGDAIIMGGLLAMAHATAHGLPNFDPERTVDIKRAVALLFQQDIASHE